LHKRITYRLFCACALLSAGVSGCADYSAASPCRSAQRFEAEAAGCIEGQVVWSGETPQVASFSYRLPAGLEHGTETAGLRANPFAPVIDPYSHGVSDAVIHLREVDPRRARRWDHPPVAIEQRDLRLHILQGGRDSGIGWARRGDPVVMVSRESLFHALRARGSTWFTLAFPDPDQPLLRPLDESGVVELTSGAGYYWMRAYLFVAEHPYYACTDADGRFTLPNVPPGRYEIVCWLPNWRETGHDRDPDTGRVTRLTFAPPAILRQTLELRARQTRDVRFVMKMSDF
jgi:hypothetical protein